MSESRVARPEVIEQSLRGAVFTHGNFEVLLELYETMRLYALQLEGEKQTLIDDLTEVRERGDDLDLLQ